jgi:trehalose-phosphatase
MLDIDGTLCEIVEQPADARVPDDVRDTLRAIHRTGGSDVHLAFVTGRSVRDAEHMLGVPGASIYGNHGMERRRASGNIVAPPGSDMEAPELRAAVPEFAGLLPAFPGTSLEDKRFTLSLHFRTLDAHLRPALEARVADIAARHTLRLSRGKCVFNVLPASGSTKGDAVLQIARGAGGFAAGASVLFAGDDTTDEDGFRALADALPNAVTVRVGPPDAGSAARFSLDAPADIHELLAMLAESRA